MVARLCYVMVNQKDSSLLVFDVLDPSLNIKNGEKVTSPVVVTSHHPAPSSSPGGSSVFEEVYKAEQRIICGTVPSDSLLE